MEGRTDTGIYIPKTALRKEYPWWLRWITPVAPKITPGKPTNYLVRCSCGRVMWLLGPEKIRTLHGGHQSKICQDGSLLEFIKVKTGLINCRTFGELTQSFLTRFENEEAIQ